MAMSLIITQRIGPKARLTRTYNPLTDGEVFHAHAMEALEIALQTLFYAAVVGRLHGMCGSSYHLDDLTVARHEFAVLEHVVGRAEHLFSILIFAVNGDVGRRAGAQVATVGKSQGARRPRSGHDGDLV
jgi:hypothetical protein